MAKARGRGKPVRRRDKKGGPGSGRRKPCQHCRDKVDQVDYKDVASLRKFISEKGKIRSRRITGSCRRHQVQIARAVKRARELALLPYVNEGGRDDSPRRDRGDRDREGFGSHRDVGTGDDEFLENLWLIRIIRHRRDRCGRRRGSGSGRSSSLGFARGG